MIRTFVEVVQFQQPRKLLTAKVVLGTTGFGRKARHLERVSTEVSGKKLLSFMIGGIERGPSSRGRGIDMRTHWHEDTHAKILRQRACIGKQDIPLQLVLLQTERWISELRVLSN